MKSKIMPIGLSFAFAGAAFGGSFTPVPLNPSSFNADVVVEASATPKLTVVTTATVDNGTNNNANTWSEIGWDTANPTDGIPPAGTVIAAQFNANYTFLMPPTYKGPNGILIDTAVTHGTFTVVTPIAYTKLSFLGSGGNGGDVIGVTVHHLDGSVEGVYAGGTTNTAYTFGCPDWFNGTLNVVYIANERCGSAENFNNANVGSNNPRLYARDIALTNTTSAVTSVDLTYYSGGSGSHNCIFAMSGDPNGSGVVNPITVTGYTYDFVVEAGGPLQGRVVDTNGVNATSSSLDSDANTGNSWYEQGYNINNIGTFSPNTAIAGASGLPHPGSTLSNAAGDHTYIMPPTYNGNDAVYVSPTIPNATITFATPTLASGLSFLGSCGNGPVAPVALVHYQNGTSQSIVLTIPDWFNTGASFVYAANGRVAVDTAVLNNENSNPKVPRLLNIDVAGLNGLVPITSIDLTYTNTGGRAAIFAVASTLAPVAPSFVIEPNPYGQYPGATAAFTALASGTAPISYHWLKGTNGVYVNLADAGNISGSATTNLTVANFTASDAADYIVIASNGGGSATSTVATLTVLSPLTAVTIPGDPITAFGGTSPTAESVDHAIDGLDAKYLNFGANGGAPFVGPVGFVTSPSMGRTVVTGIRFYTANDTVGRDPLNYILDGSNDGGASYTTIASGNLNLPAGRNTATGSAIDPTTQFMQQVLFANAHGYTTYRLTIPTIKDTTQNSMQIGEVEILGVIDTSPVPSVSTPNSVVAVDGTTGISFNVTATPASPQPTLQWQRKFGAGAWVNLADGGNVSGSASSSLNLGVVHFSDVSTFRVIANNSAGSATSAVATLTIVSSLPDVIAVGDPITSFGDNANTPGDPTITINGILDNYVNGGQGLNAQAGFPPFAGPCGLVVTPSAGPTLVSGLRIYTGSGATANDPADFALEGSDDGGATFVPITGGGLSLPAGRNSVAGTLDPTVAAMQEVLFANNHAFTTYRLTFNNVVSDATASSLQFAEFQLLGINTTAVSPKLTFTQGAGNSFNITSTVAGTLQSTTTLGKPTVWTTVGPINGTVNIVPQAGTPRTFYRVTVP